MEELLCSVIIPVYNHEPYIEQAIRSAVQQDCNFQFEVIVGDDGSTDRTNEICMKFKQEGLINLITHDENIGLLKNYQSLFKASRGNYIAILEGDDFWEPGKLGTQMDFLENNQECGLVHSNAYILYRNGKRRLIHNRSTSQIGQTYDQIFRENQIISITSCFRRTLLSHIDFNVFHELEFKTIDLPLWLEFSRHTQFGYLDKALATYRITDQSISNNRSFQKRKNFEESNKTILEYYAEKYPDSSLNKSFSEKKFHRKMFYIILGLGNFEDLKQIPENQTSVSWIKKFAFKNKQIFYLYKTFLDLFYKRI